MAKKKVTDDEEVVLNPLDIVRAQIEKGFGKGILTNSRMLEDEVRQVIPLSPMLDFGLSGGIPEGTWGLITGPAKFGKTTAMLTLAANCQKPEYGGRRVYYLDVEGRLGKKNFEIDGLNMDLLEHIHSTEEKILTAEDYLKIAEIAILNDRGCLIIIDSYSSLATEAESVNEITGTSRPGGPKLLANFCKKMGQVVPIKKCIVIGVTKKIANISGYGANTQEQGGNAVQYQQDWKIECLQKTPIHPGDDKLKKMTGQMVKWKIQNSALGSPGQEVISYITFGKGIDKQREIVELAKNFGIVDFKGAWCYVLPEKYGDEKKYNGMEKLLAGLEADPDLYEEIHAETRSVVYGS